MRIAATFLVLLVFGGLAWRLAQRPSQEYERDRLEALLDLAATHGEHREALLARLDRWVADHGKDPEVHWFAAEMRLRLGRVDEALAGIQADEALAGTPETPQRLGRLLLRSIGFERPADLDHPTALAETTAVLLTEGGDPEARSWLEARITGPSMSGFFSSLYAAFLYAERDTRLEVADWLGGRDEPEAQTTAALLRMEREPYDEREKDLVAIEQVTDSPLRWQERFVWSTACIALGRAEDPRSRAVLTDLRNRLAQSSGPQDKEDAVTLAAAEVASGRWEGLAAFSPSGPQARRSQSRVWFGDAIVHRIGLRDPRAPDAFADLWTGFERAPDPPLISRLATALLLKDALPPEAIDVAAVLAALEQPNATPDMRAVALAFRCRRGEQGAADRVVALLRELAAAGWVGSEHATQDRILVSPILTLCRALLLYSAS